MSADEKEARRKQKANERIERDVDRVRTRQVREEGRTNAKAERAKQKAKQKEPTLRDRAKSSSRKVAQWATSRPSRQTVGTYKPDIDNSSRIRQYEDYDTTDDYGNFSRKPYESSGGFGSDPFGGGFGDGNRGSFDSSPFSSGLSPRKRSRNWGPPRF